MYAGLQWDDVERIEKCPAVFLEMEPKLRNFFSYCIIPQVLRGGDNISGMDVSGGGDRNRLDTSGDESSWDVSSSGGGDGSGQDASGGDDGNGWNMSGGDDASGRGDVYCFVEQVNLDN